MTRLGPRLALALVLGVAACGGRADGEGVAQHQDPVAAPLMIAGDAAREVPARALGFASVDGYAWRTRDGHAAFRDARKAEAHDDWATVAARCEQALAADKTHLEAAYLLAAAYAELHKPDTVILAPLLTAEAGDFGKWGPASLELPALQAWLATPTGQGYRKRVDADRVTYAAALARAVLVESDGELYAFDPGATAGGAGRWYRLTRTYGAVVGALRLHALPDGTARVAYVTRTRVHHETHVAVGVVDLTTGHASRPQDVPGAPPILVADRPDGAVAITSERATGGAWLLGMDGKLVVASPRTPAAPPPKLEVIGRSALLVRRPDDVTADFDDRGLASQIRLDTSARVVAVPSPGQIDGSSITWAPDHARLALVAQLADRCTRNAKMAVFVVDGATGMMREVERGASGLAVEWLPDGRLVVAGDKGVHLYDGGAAAAADAIEIPGATDLVTPRRSARCQPEPDAGSGEPDSPAE